ncbi:glutamate formimidoyltransferase, partial [Candidatus Peregrinibacteria bacterium]|nr:glutamate formimidoyltransferase [Candidatus Peregrinibacteria bacterium]
GATDVCPLIPIKGIKELECIKYAEKLAKRVADELKIPVYLYEAAARKPERQNLADVRRGEYEAIKAEMAKNQERWPDFGPKKLGKAGITAIGVRPPLVAYNVNLKTNDIKIAQAIAKTVRAQSGGFKYVKALGFELEDRNVVQVSMNLTNYKASTVHHVFEAIKREAERHSVQVLESEVIGLIPQAALVNAAKYYLQINSFKNKQVLETRLQQKIEKSKDYLDSFLDKVASKSPVPGGGSVAALAGSLAAALSSMVANLTLAGKKYTKVYPEMEKALKKTEQLRKRLFELIKEDANAYKMVGKAYKIKDESSREKEIQKALKLAASTPQEVAETALKLLDQIKVLIEIGNPNAVSDCGVAVYLVEAAVNGAILNMQINLKEISSPKFQKDMQSVITQLYKNLESKAAKLKEAVNQKLK